MKARIAILLSAMLVLITGCAPSVPDCADPLVKETITNHYLEGLLGSGIPDLVRAINQKKIEFSLGSIAEIGKNKESKRVTCSALLTIKFPTADLEAAIKARESDGVAAATLTPEIPSNPVFSTKINYSAAISPDKNEQKGGAIVEQEMALSSDGDILGKYIAAYTHITYAAPDLTDLSKNEKKWEQKWKQSIVDECTKAPQNKTCACTIDQLETKISQLDMERIIFIAATNKILFGSKYPNYIRFNEQLNEQCPLQQSLQIQEHSNPDVNMTTNSSKVNDKSGETSANAVNSTQPTNSDSHVSSVTATNSVTSVAATSGQNANSIAEASFDCRKAISRIEKLICASPVAATSDKQLALAYQAVRSKSKNPDEIRLAQIKWNREVRDACNDQKCLVEALQQRTKQLALMVE